MAVGGVAAGAAWGGQPERGRPPASRPGARRDWSAQGEAHRGAAVIASGNGERTVARAFELIAGGADPAVAAVEGVGIVEADPEDMTVGYGGLPNEQGVVELDSSVMHGPTHRAGAVASLRNIMHPARVALKVLQTTDHVLIVGEGALAFAKAHGFPEQDLLTEKAREAWLKWKRSLSDRDDWLDLPEMDWNAEGTRALAPGEAQSLREDHAPFTYGTIHCSARTASGDLAGCTTTSGLSYKIPGRVGDSPIIGAGCYTDNDAGSAGATGRGEAVMESCGSFAVVEAMRRGLAPTEACLEVLERMARNCTRQRRLRNALGQPNFNVTLYAVRADGAWGSASMREGGTFAICDAPGAARVLPSAYLYPAE